jgi:2,3-bisphosphoglycerate-independent phosphoglycerate mutase
MLDAHGEVLTQHSKFPVPVVVVTPEGWTRPSLSNDRDRALCDLAPTILDLMGIDKPKEMEGVSLFAEKQVAVAG